MSFFKNENLKMFSSFVQLEVLTKYNTVAFVAARLTG